MKSLRFLNLLLGSLFSLPLTATSVSAQTSPVPFIDILSPTSTYPGHGGANFASGATVQFDGLTLTPSSVARNSLTVKVPATAVAFAHTASITVKDPNSNSFNLIKSNVAFFPITTVQAFLEWTNAFSVLGPPTRLGASPSPPATAIAVGDFNEDSHQDMVVALPGLLQLYAGDGKGNFTAAGSVSTGLSTIGALETGDFNNDGHLDVAAVTDGSTLAIFFNDGTGVLTAGPTTSLPIGFEAYGHIENGCDVSQRFAVADVNGDGSLDLVFPSGTSPGVAVFLGDGQGHFSQSSAVSSPSWACGITVGDFNGDGWVDVAYGDGRNNAYFSFNDGTGGFTSANTFNLNALRFPRVRLLPGT